MTVFQLFRGVKDLQLQMVQAEPKGASLRMVKGSIIVGLPGGIRRESKGVL